MIKSELSTGNVVIALIISVFTRMGMNSTRLLLAICLFCSGIINAAPLSPETVRRHASDLLFFLGSGDTTLSEEQLNTLLSKEGEAIGLLYQKVYKNRMKAIKSQEYLDKKLKSEKRDYYTFKNWEIRQAVIELLVELGNGALEVLLESIHSARQEIVLGVVKALDHEQINDNRVVLLLSDVLELDKWQRSKFSSLVRRQAVFNLRRYMDQEMALNLLTQAIIDLDPMVRQVAQEVIGQANSDYGEYVQKTYIEGYNFELSLIQKELEQAEARGVSEQFQKDVFSLSSMSLMIENMAMYVPKAFHEIHIPGELLGHRGLVRTFLVHHKSLPEAMRLRIINKVLDDPSDNLVQLDALKAMKKTDGKHFLSKMKSCLDIKNDPAVIYQALQWCAEWGIDDYRDEIQLIATNVRQKSLRDLAQQFLENL